MNPDAVNLIDLAAICLLIAGLVGGIRSGAFPQVGGLLGAIAGAALLLALVPEVRDKIDSLQGPTRAFVVLGGLVIGVGIGEVLGSSLGRSISSSLGDGVFGTLDRVLGGVVGVAQAILVVWLVGGLIALGPSTALAGQAQRSIAVRMTAAALPPIETVAADVGGLIDASGLPQVFIGLEPIPAPPVDTPQSAEARRIAAAAMASTAEIGSFACAFELTGTGFIVAPGYVVTNAHVVAGASATHVTIGDQTVNASVVFFDPELDIALLHAPGLSGKALRFATTSPERGTQGAALGHPGGAPLTVIPAAVAGSYEAEGRDLYGTRTVTRAILELRASIERGDSGGPFILPDGTVGGVVFAEARSDPRVGYALDPRAVATDIAPSLSRTAPVATGPCIR